MSGRSLRVSMDAIPYLSLDRSSKPTHVGTLHFSPARNGEAVSFEFSSTWLAVNPLTSFDPDLQPWKGRQYLEAGKPLFGVFSDSCPDRWGRMLLQRKENERAHAEGRSARALLESDFLVGVSDRTRMGALRYQESGDGPFLAEDSANDVPPVSSLRELEHAARGIEASPSNERRDSVYLDLLLSPGSSLGGARPKASVRDQTGDLWIAKFPSRHDSFDTGIVEFFTHDLARSFGIDVPDAQKGRFGRHGTTFLSKRFARITGKRVHFSSAMALLGRQDGACGADGASYLDLMEFMREQCARPERDLEELYRRILFSVAVSNTDDHLRNHGFLLGNDGWHLAPAFDMNPNPLGRSLSLNIDEASGVLSYALVRDQAPYFGVSNRQAQRMEHDIKALTKSWRARAKRVGLSSSECDAVAPVFERTKE